MSYVETMIAQLRSNADAHQEPEGTERRRAADALELLFNEYTTALTREEAWYDVGTKAQDENFALREVIERAKAVLNEATEMQNWWGSCMLAHRILSEETSP